MTAPVCTILVATTVLGVGLGADVARADRATTATMRECAPPDGQNPHADPTLAPPTEPDAAAHMKRGTAAHRAQDYDEAIAEFKAGAKLSPAPVFLYSLGQSLRVAGRFEEAIRAYTLFLDRAQPGPALRGVVECHIGNMRAELDRAAMTMPPTDQPSDTPVALPPVIVVEPAPRWYDDPAGWAFAGGGVVGLAIGGALLVSAASLEDDAAREDRQPVREALRDKAATRRTWGGVVTAAGAVALVAGAVMLAITPDPPHGARGAALVPGPGTVGLGVVVRF